MTDAILENSAHAAAGGGHAATPGHAEGQSHPLRLYLVVWGWLFVLSACSYMVDYIGLRGGPRWTLILIFMCLKAGLIVAFFMHMAWERLALVYAICLPVIAIFVFVAIMAFESSYTLQSRETFFALLADQPPFPVVAPAGQGPVPDLPVLVLHTLLAVVWAAVLALGFAGLIFLGAAEARGRPLVSRRFDGRATLLLCLSWFSLPLWFGFGQLLLILACAAALLLCGTYAASYQAARTG